MDYEVFMLSRIARRSTAPGATRTRPSRGPGRDRDRDHLGGAHHDHRVRGVRVRRRAGDAVSRVRPGGGGAARRDRGADGAGPGVHASGRQVELVARGSGRRAKGERRREGERERPLPIPSPFALRPSPTASPPASSVRRPHPPRAAPRKLRCSLHARSDNLDHAVDFTGAELPGPARHAPSSNRPASPSARSASCTRIIAILIRSAAEPCSGEFWASRSRMRGWKFLSLISGT